MLFYYLFPKNFVYFGTILSKKSQKILMNILHFINAYKTTTPRLGGNVIPKSFGIPNFQRQFEWDEKKIQTLFDSLYNGLPLPLIFEWDVVLPQQVTACTLIDNDPFEAVHFGPNTKLICDGQQRLSSLIIGILNHGTDKVGNKNLFVFLDNLEYANGMYFAKNIFKFKNPNQVQRGECNLQAYKLNDLYNFFIENIALPPLQKVNNWIAQKYPNLNNDIVDENIREHIRRATEGVFKMFEYVLPVKNISAEIQHRPDLALEFFIRINQGGKNLKKADLIYSICCIELENALINLRQEFTGIQEYGRGLGLRQLDNEYLMRCIIYLHFDALIWRHDVFDANNAAVIAQNWPRIKQSVILAFQLVANFGIVNNIKSNNSLIPIIFHFFKTAERTHNYGITINESRELLTYLIASRFSTVWGNHGDTMLRCLKTRQNGIYPILNPHNTYFNCNELVNDAHMPHDFFGLPNKSFTLSRDKISNIIANYPQFAQLLLDNWGGLGVLNANGIPVVEHQFNFE